MELVGQNSGGLRMSRIVCTELHKGWTQARPASTFQANSLQATVSSTQVGVSHATALCWCRGRHELASVICPAPDTITSYQL
jgi:hypothetical protein